MVMEQPSLYKYIPFQAPALPDSGTLQQKRQTCFENGEIWYPQANKLNDPFDSNPDFELPVSDEQKMEAVVNSLTELELKIIEEKTGIPSKEALLKVLKTPDAMKLKGSPSGSIPNDFIHQSLFLGAISAIFSVSLSNVGVLSLSEDHLNLRMWAHYAGNSTGICIEFQRTRENILGSESTRKVNYVKSRPKILLHQRHESINEIITTKSYSWEFEREWRDIKPTGDKPYPFPGKVQKVFFGLNAHMETKKVIKNIFGSEVEYEEISLGSDFSLQTDCGLNHAMSKVELTW